MAAWVTASGQDSHPILARLQTTQRSQSTKESRVLRRGLLLVVEALAEDFDLEAKVVQWHPEDLRLLCAGPRVRTRPHPSRPPITVQYLHFGLSENHPRLSSAGFLPQRKNQANFQPTLLSTFP